MAESRFPPRPTGKPIDIKEVARRCYAKWPKTMEALRQAELREREGMGG